MIINIVIIIISIIIVVSIYIIFDQNRILCTINIVMMGHHHGCMWLCLHVVARC